MTDPLEKRAYTDGSVLHGNKVRLIDADGNDIPPGQVGEIVTTGPELYLGYTDPALDAAAFLPGGGTGQVTWDSSTRTGT